MVMRVDEKPIHVKANRNQPGLDAQELRHTKVDPGQFLWYELLLNELRKHTYSPAWWWSSP